MEYKVTEIKGTYPSNYPDSKKYVFRVGDYEHDLSGFSKFPIKVGDEINGDITIKGQYHNFKFVPKSSHQVNKMGGEDMVKLHAKLDAIWTKLGVIQGLIQPKAEEPRREFDTTDEREADIKPEDMPW